MTTTDAPDVGPGPVPDGAGPVPRRVARRSATDGKITAAVFEIIRTDGVQSVTIDAVSAHSGVAKTTIYRRYRDRFELLADVLDRLVALPDEREAELSKDGLADLIGAMQVAFEERVGLAYVGQVLASEEEFLARLREKVAAPWLGTFSSYFARGVAAGVFVPDVDYELLIDMVIGGMVIRDARRGEVPDDWTSGVVTLLWPLIRA